MPPADGVDWVSTVYDPRWENPVVFLDRDEVRPWDCNIGIARG